MAISLFPKGMNRLKKKDVKFKCKVESVLCVHRDVTVKNQLETMLNTEIKKVRTGEQKKINRNVFVTFMI